MERRRINHIAQRVSDTIIDLMIRPMGIRRKREGQKIIYTASKAREPLRSEVIETETETQIIYYYREDETTEKGKSNST